MIGRTNAEIPGSDNITYVHYPTATSGITVTASKTGTTKTAITDANGIATFKHLELGYTWTFTAGSYSATEYLGDLIEDVEFLIAVEIYGVNDGWGDYLLDFYHLINGSVSGNSGTYDSAEVIEQITPPSGSGSTYLTTFYLKIGEYYATRYASYGNRNVRISKNDSSTEINTILFEKTGESYLYGFQMTADIVKLKFYMYRD